MPSPDDILKMISQAAKATPNKGKDDQIAAKLSPGEYVIKASDVALLGDGDNKAGARVLEKALEQLRATKRPKKVKSKGNGMAEGGLVKPLKKGAKIPLALTGLYRTLGIL